MTLDVEQPSWTEIFQAAQARYSSTVHTSMPGTIVDYDEATQLATIQLGVQAQDGASEGEKFATIPPLTGVPIDWPAGGGYAITMPLAAGDPVLVSFSESDPSAWRQTAEPSPPRNYRRHGLYAFATPCGGIDGSHLKFRAGKLVISSAGAEGAQFVLDPDFAHVGGFTSAQLLALSNLVDDRLATIQSTFDTHVHTASGPGAPTSPPVDATTASPALIGPLASTAATKAKGV